MREAITNKIPYTLVIGDNEMNDKTVTYRIYGTTDQITVSLNDFIKLVNKDIENKTVRYK